MIIAAPSCGGRTGEQREIIEDQPWVVDLAEGTYVVWIESAFARADGLVGSTSVALGLVVDKARREIIEPRWMNCSPSFDEDAGL